MKTKIYDLWESVPSEREPVWCSYDNKKIKNWDSDDFANFVFDKSDLDLKLCDGDTFIHAVPWFKEMCENIPVIYPRVYLYGVWECVKEKLRTEYIIKYQS
jgi:hypothetical protein